MKFSRTTWFTGAVVVVSLAAAAIIGGSQAEPDTGPTDVRTPVSVESLQARALPGEVRAGGFLRAIEDVTIAAERAGRVIALPVAEGDRVAAGGVVARLDDEIAAANVARARAVARETALEPNVPAAEAARVREALRLAEHELALRRPAAPIAGLVELHHVDVGEHVVPGQPLVDVIDTSRLVLDVDVDAEVVATVARGDAVGVAVPVRADAAPLAGTVTRVAARASAATRRFRLEVTVPVAADAVARAGMYAEAILTMPAGAPALYVPKSATRRVRGENGVFVVVEGVARWLPVRVVEVYHRPDLWRVVGGDLADGASLVVRGFSGLRAGMRVEVVR